MMADIASLTQPLNRNCTMEHVTSNMLPTHVDGNVPHNNETFYNTNLVIEISYVVLSSIIICGGNALVIIVVACTPSLRTITNVLLVNLAVADLLFGFHQLLEILVATILGTNHSCVECCARIFVETALPAVSCFTLLGKYTLNFVSV